MKKQVKFAGIDGFGRPIFKQVDAKLYYGCTDKVFSPFNTQLEADESEVLKKVSEADLCYFGSSFNCEPMGTPAGDIEIIN
jgi:hypothetical protein